MKKFGKNMVLLLGLLIGAISLLSTYSASTNRILQKLSIEEPSEVHISGINRSLHVKGYSDVFKYDHKGTNH